ncbi:MAG: lasso peptide isopeptide bond-forming cyclase [Cyanobacteria bacterium]|nr:lasso peptide isopeptide bond-forming cyclase [Cyanobacteriota bacterium]
MGGIGGIFNRNGHSLDPAHLAQMVHFLAHRGPDGTDSWWTESIGLTHCMLWTTPESLHEKLPAQNSSGSLVMTADARIDNRNELVEELGWKDLGEQLITDSQLILGAYEMWGEACPTKLLGDFAFAIWDQSQQCLFGARDHLGVKPFYYHQSPDRFAFASEIKALLGLPGVTRLPNFTKLGDFLLLMMQDKVLTTYQDVLRLPPAHTLKVTAEALEIKPYWSLDPSYELRLDSSDAYAQEFCRIFTEAVRCRLRSAFPMGAHLSGGLDSSAVVCVARKLLQQVQGPRLQTISNIFDEVTDCDERPYINAVLALGDLIPHYIHADQFGPLTDLETIRQVEDEALLGPSHHYPWRLSQKAQEIGLRVVLDGLDGDNVVCHGITRLKELADAGRWQLFAQEVKAVAKHYQQSPVSLFQVYGVHGFQRHLKSLHWVAAFNAGIILHRQLGLSRKALLWRWGVKSVLVRPLKSLINRWLRRKFSTDPRRSTGKTSLLTPQFLEACDFESRLQALDINPHAAATVREGHWRSLDHGVIPLVLEQFDRTAAACSIEERHPFMDKRLIEFCLSLPAEYKLNQGWGRFVLRQGLAGILPEAIRWRSGKADMTANFEHGLRKIDRSILEQMVAHSLSTIEPLVRLDIFWKSYPKVLAGQGREKDLMLVWRVIVLANWLKVNKNT